LLLAVAAVAATRLLLAAPGLVVVQEPCVIQRLLFLLAVSLLRWVAAAPHPPTVPILPSTGLHLLAGVEAADILPGVEAKQAVLAALAAAQVLVRFLAPALLEAILAVPTLL
jgi:hypothetical protein